MPVPDQSPAYAQYRKTRRRERLLILAAQGLLLAGTLALWELAASLRWVNPMLTSRPSAIWATLLKLAATGAIWRHTAITAVETLTGFLISMGLGVAVAVLLWWCRPLAQVLDPYLVVLNAMPKIALGPIFYIWLGESRSIYGMAVAITVVVTVVMLQVGFQEVDPQQLRLMQTLGANKVQILQKVVFPASLPALLGAVKVNIGLTLVGVIVGEFISSKAGLGYLIIYGGQVFQMELVMTSIMILALISAVAYLLVAWAERLVARLLHFPVKG